MEMCNKTCVMLTGKINIIQEYGALNEYLFQSFNHPFTVQYICMHFYEN